MATGEDHAAPRKGGKLTLLVLLLVCGLAVAGGFTLPMFLHLGHAKKAAAPPKTKKPALIQFGDIVVNLSEERLSRYLRAKLIIVVDETDLRTTEDLLQKQKPFLKNWLISYLADQSLQEVSGAGGVNRLRREIRDRFNAMLFPDGSEHIEDILFDEFVVQ
jgi:flagellar basal body-associated protein FliL